MSNRRTRAPTNRVLAAAALAIPLVGAAFAQQMLQVEPPAPQAEPRITAAPTPRLAPSNTAPPSVRQETAPAPANQPLVIAPVLPSVFRGCWDGTVGQLDAIHRLAGAHPLGYWTPKTYRLCYKRVGNGPYQLTFGEAGVVPTEKIAYAKGRVEVIATGGGSWARLRAFLHFDEYYPGAASGPTFAVDEVTTLECSIDRDRMNVSADVSGRRNDQPWFRASWHTAFVKVPQ